MGAVLALGTPHYPWYFVALLPFLCACGSTPWFYLASGAALVTTAVGGVKEYAVHGENALVCEPGNAAALREQVLRLVRDRALRDRLKTNGLQTASSFSVEHSAERLLEFLREVYEETHNGASTMVNA